jgi:pilus assembly protein CpaF
MKIELTSTDPRKEPIVLNQFPVIVGLDPGADICLDDSSLGHYQCMIDHDENGLMVWDLGTKSGTYINGVRVVKKAPLTPGDELTIGRNRFTVEFDNAASCQPAKRKPSRTVEAAAKDGQKISAAIHRAEPAIS